jgi:putative sterol carrier protein
VKPAHPRPHDTHISGHGFDGQPFGNMHGGQVMDATAEFFQRLNLSRPRMLSKHKRSTLRVDLVRGASIDHWFVAFDEGLVRVSREDHPADCILRVSKDIFDRFVGGDLEGFPLLLTNKLAIEGDFQVLSTFRKLTPDHTGAHDPREFARERAKRR